VHYWKNVIGFPSHTLLQRTDREARVLRYPQRQLCPTLAAALLNIEELPVSTSMLVAIVEFDAMVTEDGIGVHKASVEREMAADDTFFVYSAVVPWKPRTERKGALDIDGVQSTLVNPKESLDALGASNRYGALPSGPLCAGCGYSECERLSAICDRKFMTTGLPRRNQYVRRG
jgi:DNA-directed RNA polymerase beta subunit